jgi:hypothetical protein
MASKRPFYDLGHVGRLIAILEKDVPCGFEERGAAELRPPRFRFRRCLGGIGLRHLF